MHDIVLKTYTETSIPRSFYLRSHIPIVSLIECIDNCGIPISIARMPVAELISGPIVDPCSKMAELQMGRIESNNSWETRNVS